MEFTVYSYITLCVLLTNVFLVKSTETHDKKRDIKDEISSLMTTSRFEFDDLSKTLAPYVELERRISSVMAAIGTCRQRNPNAYLGISQANLNQLLDDSSEAVKAMGHMSAYAKAASNELAAAKHWNVWCWKELATDETNYTFDNLPYYCKLFYTHHGVYQLLMVHLYGALAQCRHKDSILNCVNITCTNIEALMERNYPNDLAEARGIVIKKWTNIVKEIDRQAKRLEADENMDIEKALGCIDAEDGDELNMPAETACNDNGTFTPYAYTVKPITTSNGLQRVLAFWKGTQSGEAIGFTREHYLLMTGMAILAVTQCF